MNNKYIIILLIDHNSTSEQIIISTLKKLKKGNDKYLIIGDSKFYKKLKKKIYVTNFISNEILKKKIFFYNIESKKISKYKFINKIVDVAINLLDKKIAKALINMPINKKLYLQNKYNGFTEFFAKKLNQANHENMLLFNENLSVLPLTTHIEISKVSKKITTKIIKKAILNVSNFYNNIIKKKPYIKILGLNPHSGIDFNKKTEETKIIIPLIKKIKKTNKHIQGLFSADTAYLNYKKERTNNIIGMYHDQVLPTFKTLFKFNAANITIGLKYFRLSPDHGTGKDLMRKKSNISNKSFLYCVNFCEKYL